MDLDLAFAWVSGSVAILVLGFALTHVLPREAGSLAGGDAVLIGLGCVATAARRAVGRPMLPGLLLGAAIGWTATGAIPVVHDHPELRLALLGIAACIPLIALVGCGRTLATRLATRSDDPETGLPGHEDFELALEAAASAARRGPGEPMVVSVYARGETVDPRAFAEAFRRVLYRPVDRAFRLSRAEFVALLPGMDAGAMQIMSGRLERELRHMDAEVQMKPATLHLEHRRRQLRPADRTSGG